MTEFLVLRIRENSCALKQLDMELMVEKSGMSRNPFNISSLSLVFSNLIIVFLGVLLFIFLLLVCH